MPACFTMPMHSTMFGLPPMYRRRSPACCLSPMRGLVFFLALLFLPSLLRIAFFALEQLVFIFLIGSVVSAVSELAQETSCCVSKSSSSSCDNAHVSNPCATTTETQGDGNDARKKPGNTPASHELSRRHDLSSVRVHPSGEGVRIVVATPGIRHEDLEVSVMDRMLRIKGETKRGPDTFDVDQELMVPSSIDADTAECMHAEGELTITIKRRAGKRIEVERVQDGHAVQDAPHGLETEAPSTPSDAEWDLAKEE